MFELNANEVYAEYGLMKNEALENRLIDFAVSVSEICNNTRRNELGINLCQQLIRSSTSPALNYGEAQGAESRKDFIHKMRVSLKELRESYVSLRILKRAKICSIEEELDRLIDESNQLVSIFVASIKTAESKLNQIKQS